jgi:uncharacterized RDD family membrane protein YckC
MTDDRFELPLFPHSHREPGHDLEDAPLHGGVVTARAAEPSVLPQRPAARPRPPEPAGVGSRLAAGVIDLLVHAALCAVLLGGSSLLGAPVRPQHAVPLAFVILVFSYLYYVVPLAFWGRTPGMAVAGLRARTLDDKPLSLPQAGKHWLALLLTAATGGLGTLLALGGRSLADRLSGTQTLVE